MTPVIQRIKNQHTIRI